jgi:hypothetical protein
MITAECRIVGENAESQLEGGVHPSGKKQKLVARFGSIQRREFNYDSSVTGLAS